MNMTMVPSSNLVAVGYDETSSTLRVQFKSGTYDYYNVPFEVFNGLLAASSKGQYHHAYIKTSYRFRKVS